MPAVKAARPLDIFTREEWSELTALSRWRGVWLVAHGWLVALAACALTGLAWQWHWLAGLAATPFALAIVGGRQLGLAILMHGPIQGRLAACVMALNFHTTAAPDPADEDRVPAMLDSILAHLTDVSADLVALASLDDRAATPEQG